MLKVWKSTICQQNFNFLEPLPFWRAPQPPMQIITIEWFLTSWKQLIFTTSHNLQFWSTHKLYKYQGDTSLLDVILYPLYSRGCLTPAPAPHLLRVMSSRDHVWRQLVSVGQLLIFVRAAKSGVTWKPWWSLWLLWSWWSIHWSDVKTNQEWVRMVDPF